MDSKSVSSATGDIPAAGSSSSIANISVVPVTEGLITVAEKPLPTSSTGIAEVADLAAELGLSAGLMVHDTGFEVGFCDYQWII